MESGLCESRCCACFSHPGSSLLQPRRKQVSYESPLSAEFDQLDVSDIAPELLEPIPDDGETRTRVAGSPERLFF